MLFPQTVDAAALVEFYFTIPQKIMEATATLVFMPSHLIHLGVWNLPIYGGTLCRPR